jgi:murein DD-endopeptidase MepM/ murein hydrolase activator NlpD
VHTLPFVRSAHIVRVTALYHRKAGNMSHAVDFMMPVGTDIFASMSGIVVERESRYNTNYKHPKFAWKTNYLIIRHDDGTEALYAHLAWRSVVPSLRKRVAQGQVIAQSGETGYSTYPHLHFALYDDSGKNIPCIFGEQIPEKLRYKRALRLRQ